MLIVGVVVVVMVLVLRGLLAVDMGVTLRWLLVVALIARSLAAVAVVVVAGVGVVLTTVVGGGMVGLGAGLVVPGAALVTGVV